MWAKGQSGNPSGMAPHVAQMVHKAREKAASYTEMAIDKLIDIIKNPGTKDTTCISAINVLLDKIMPKLPSNIEDPESINGISPSKMTSEQLRMVVDKKASEYLKSLDNSGELDQYIKSKSST